MFGYIKIYKPELKLKNISNYSGYYCALCKEIEKEFGEIYRLFLSYDVTYLVVALNELFEDEISLCTSCMGKNNKKQVTYSRKAIKYGAFINTYLALKKIEDNFIDEKNCL